jgi:hypothetical protein
MVASLHPVCLGLPAPGRFERREAGGGSAAGAGVRRSPPQFSNALVDAYGFSKPFMIRPHLDDTAQSKKGFKRHDFKASPHLSDMRK